MKTLYNTTISLTNMDESLYDKLIDFLEDNFKNYEETDFEEFIVDERTEEEKYNDWLWEQADIYNEEVKLGLIKEPSDISKDLKSGLKQE